MHISVKYVPVTAKNMQFIKVSGLHFFLIITRVITTIIAVMLTTGC